MSKSINEIDHSSHSNTMVIGGRTLVKYYPCEKNIQTAQQTHKKKKNIYKEYSAYCIIFCCTVESKEYIS